MNEIWYSFWLFHCYSDDTCGNWIVILVLYMLLEQIWLCFLEKIQFGNWNFPGTARGRCMYGFLCSFGEFQMSKNDWMSET